MTAGLQILREGETRRDDSIAKDREMPMRPKRGLSQVPPRPHGKRAKTFYGGMVVQ